MSSHQDVPKHHDNQNYVVSKNGKEIGLAFGIFTTDNKVVKKYVNRNPFNVEESYHLPDDIVLTPIDDPRVVVAEWLKNKKGGKGKKSRPRKSAKKQHKRRKSRRNRK